MGSQEPPIHEVWVFGSNGITREVHPEERVYVGVGVVGELSSNYLTESGCRIPILERISINVSAEWLGAPDLHRTGGPFWAANFLATRSSWGYGGNTTNKNWGIQHGGPYGSVVVLWSRPVHVCPS